MIQYDIVHVSLLWSIQRSRQAYIQGFIWSIWLWLHIPPVSECFVQCTRLPDLRLLNLRMVHLDVASVAAAPLQSGG